MIVTCLYKDDIYPIIRFNTHDVTKVVTRESIIGLNFKRIEGFLGRSDNMVKIRGINIYPQAMGSILETMQDFTGQFVRVANRDEKGRDDVCVLAESNDHNNSSLIEEYQSLLKQKMDVEMRVELMLPTALNSMTGIETRQNPIRLIDNRFP